MTNDMSQLPDPLHLREQLYGLEERTLMREEPVIVHQEENHLPGTSTQYFLTLSTEGEEIVSDVDA